jgi:VCBS repeat-containing protein
MAKLIRVWDGTEWQSVGVALPYSYITINGEQIDLGGSTTIATGPTAQAVSSNITMAANYNYFVDTSAARTLTLPASPSLGDTIAVYDASGTAATNNITIARNGNKINGQTENAIIDVDQSGSIFIYTGSTLGWRFD